jgi:pectate disaccharide-lyase
LPVAHIVRNNLAFDNNMDGYTDNFNPGKMIVENNTAFNNKRFNYVFRINPYFTAEEQGTFKNNLSFRTESGSLKDFISGNNDATNFFFDGIKTANSEGTVINAEDFVTLNAPDKFDRDIEANILFGSFLRLAPDSMLNHAGANNGYVGALPADPLSIVLEGPRSLREGEKAQFVVKAKYFDGSVKTLSAGVQFESADSTNATINQEGILHAAEKGKTQVSASYHGLTTVLNIHVKQMPPGLKKEK